MDEYILISTLNDFIFCPYSIYLHNIYMDADESLYHATPQTKGRLAHEKVDNKTTSHAKGDLMALSVYSQELNVMGKIDLYKSAEKMLIERKFNLKNIFQGQIYQLWAQYFCMIEMGYEVEKIAFYEISAKKLTIIPTPSQNDKQELESFLSRYISYNPETTPITINYNKCKHCIYCNLCDKTIEDNVYI